MADKWKPKVGDLVQFTGFTHAESWGVRRITKIVETDNPIQYWAEGVSGYENCNVRDPRAAVWVPFNQLKKYSTQQEMEAATAKENLSYWNELINAR